MHINESELKLIKVNFGEKKNEQQQVEEVGSTFWLLNKLHWLIDMMIRIFIRCTVAH